MVAGPESEAGVALVEQDSLPALGQDTVLHGEAVLVEATGDFEQVAIEEVGDNSAFNLVSNFPVDEFVHLLVVLEFHNLVSASLGT